MRSPAGATKGENMASNDTGGGTSAKVARLATHHMKLDRLAVIGIYGNDTDPRALVRENDGTITRVQVGDTLVAGIVTAIGDDAVVLSRRGGNTVLKLPQT